MNLVIRFIVFFIMLFLYIHIYHHTKTSSDLELYELDIPTKTQLEEICDVRQPVKFKYNEEPFLEYTNLSLVEENYGVFDVKIRNMKQYLDSSSSPFYKTQDLPLEQESYIPFLLTKAIPLFQKDKSHKFYSENNQQFLQETGITKKYQYYDSFLRPHMVSSCEYDYMIGTNQTHTPLRYRLDYRSYYMVSHGKITIMMIPPSYSQYLQLLKNYDLFEFSSPINPWNVQPQFQHDFEKIKTLTLTLQRGDVLYIPSYWWYSIRFDELSSVAVFHYRTYMNTISILPHLGMYALQHANVKHQIAKVEDTVKVFSGINVMKQQQ